MLLRSVEQNRCSVNLSRSLHLNLRLLNIELSELEHVLSGGLLNRSWVDEWFRVCSQPPSVCILSFLLLLSISRRSLDNCVSSNTINWHIILAVIVWLGFLLVHHHCILIMCSLSRVSAFCNVGMREIASRYNNTRSSDSSGVLNRAPSHSDASKHLFESVKSLRRWNRKTLK